MNSGISSGPSQGKTLCIYRQALPYILFVLMISVRHSKLRFWSGDLRSRHLAVTPSCAVTRLHLANRIYREFACVNGLFRKGESVVDSNPADRGNSRWWYFFEGQHAQQRAVDGATGSVERRSQPRLNKLHADKTYVCGSLCCWVR